MFKASLQTVEVPTTEGYKHTHTHTHTYTRAHTHTLRGNKLSSKLSVRHKTPSEEQHDFL